MRRLFPILLLAVLTAVFQAQASVHFKWVKVGNGTYTLYATGSAAPTVSAPTSQPNCANYNNVVGTFTDVGAYTGSPSHYGTFDQAGNIWNWNETIFPDLTRSARGNAYVHDVSKLASTFRHHLDPGGEGLHVGFRVARAPGFSPHPGILKDALITGAALAAGCVWFWWKYRRRRA